MALEDRMARRNLALKIKQAFNIPHISYKSFIRA
jgi:hypothetical protein